MSSTAPQLRSRLPHVAPRLAQAALERARLSVVPRRRTRAPRVPFVTFVSVILLAGVVGLLLFNTSMQQASFRATALADQATDLGAQQEALEMQIQSLREPARVARAAQKLGMVIPPTAAVLDLRTGKVRGNPVPASAADSIPLQMPGPSKPALLDPRPVKVKVEAKAKAKVKVGPKVRVDPKPNAGRDGAPTRNR